MKVKDKKIFLLFSVFLLVVIFNKWQVFTSQSYLNSGNEKISDGNMTSSLNDYKYAAVVDGNRDVAYEARIKRAKIFLKVGKPDRAQDEINIALKENKLNYQAYEIMGDIEYYKGDISRALKDYREAIELDNKDEINIKLAKSFIAKDEINTARELLLKLSLHDNNNIEVIYYLGLLDYYDNMVYNDYFVKIEKIADNQFAERIMTIKDNSINNENVNHQEENDLLIAYSFMEINEPYLAINKSKEILEAKPNYRDAWFQLGKAYFILERYNEALDCFHKAFELDSNNSEITFWIATTYEKIGNHLQANQFFEKSKQL